MSKAEPPSLPTHNGPNVTSRLLGSKPGTPPLPTSPSPAPNLDPPTSRSETAEYSLLTPLETATRLSTSLSHGLTPSEAASRIITHGQNELPQEEAEPLWLRFVKQFKETLILLLLGSAGVSFLMGNWDDAVSITVAVVIVVTVGFVQEYRSEKSLEALHSLVPNFAHVIRGEEYGQGGQNKNAKENGGVEMKNMGPEASLEEAESLSTTIEASQLVPGDLVLFHTGDRIPADVRITHAVDLAIDESN